MANNLSGTKQYGDTEFKDRSLHQGDVYRNVSTRVEVRDIVVNLPLPLARRFGRSPRNKTSSVRRRQQPTSVSKRRVLGNQRDGRILADDSLVGEEIVESNDELGIEDTSAGDEQVGDGAQSRSNAAPLDRQYHRLSQRTSHKSSAVAGPHILPQNENSVTVATDRDAQIQGGEEFLWLCALILSYMLSRQISTQNVLSFLMQCPQDQFFPLLTCIFGAGLYHYMSSRLSRDRHPLQHRLVLEDAYGQKQYVDFNLFTNLTVVENFLIRHYDQTSGSAAKHLMQQRQYHLMLGSRRGFVLRRETWATVGNLLKPGCRVVNAVYINTMTTTCLSCGTSLIVSALGEFHCYDCHTFCRDYDTLVTEDHWQHCHDNDTVSNDLNLLPDESSKYYELDRLRNVDMRIVPPPMTRKPAKSTVVSTASQNSTESPASHLGKVRQARLASTHAENLKATTHKSPDILSRDRNLTSARTSPHQSMNLASKCPSKGVTTKTSLILSRMTNGQQASSQSLWSPVRTTEERLVFNLHRYTHAAYCIGNWNPESHMDNDSGRQAVRAFASQLKAGRSLYDDGKKQLALTHWKRASTSTQDPNLLNTWYHETPIRLLFELSCMVYSDHNTLAGTLLKEIKTSAEKNLQKKDARYDLFNTLCDFETTQLRGVHSIVARTLYKSLENRLGKNHHQLYEVRLNRALDLLGLDARADVADWIPSTDEVDKMFEPNSPFSVYFLLLESYRLAATGLYEQAIRACSRADAKLEELQAIEADINYWRVELAYNRLGEMLQSQGRFQDAFRVLKKALDLVADREQSTPVEIRICQHLESIATILKLPDECWRWSTRLSELEQIRF